MPNISASCIFKLKYIHFRLHHRREASSSDQGNTSSATSKMWSEKFLWPQSQGFFLTTIPGIFFVTTIPGTDFVTTIPGMIMNKSLVRIQLQSVLQRDIASYDPFLRISWLWSNAQTLISPHYIRVAIFFHSKVPFPFALSIMATKIFLFRSHFIRTFTTIQSICHS